MTIGRDVVAVAVCRDMLRLHSRPVRTVLRWQLLATAAGALAGGYFAGAHGALSAALGGAVSVAAGLVFVGIAARAKAATLEAALARALGAEAAKIGAIVVLLWLVFAVYENVIATAFIGVFALTVIIFSLAFFVRDV